MDQLIGRRMMDKLKDSSGRDVVIYEPSMATYIVHGERHAVPVRAIIGAPAGDWHRRG